MNAETGGNHLWHKDRLARARRSVVYDPSQFSPEDINALVAQASRLCAQVEALCAMRTPAEIAVRLLEQPMIGLRAELVHLGAIPPRENTGQ